MSLARPIRGDNDRSAGAKALRLPGGDFLVRLPPTPRLDAYLDRLPQREWRSYHDDGAPTVLRVSNDAAIGLLIRVKRHFPALIIALRPPSVDGPE